MEERGWLRPRAGQLRHVGVPHHPQPGDGRKARVRTVDGEPLFEPGETDPSGALSQNFDVAAALSRLTPVHREVLVLAYFHGLSQREISDRTATPLGTVKSRTTAALRALRETMRFDEDRWSADE